VCSTAERYRARFRPFVANGAFQMLSNGAFGAKRAEFGGPGGGCLLSSAGPKG